MSLQLTTNQDKKASLHCNLERDVVRKELVLLRISKGAAALPCHSWYFSNLYTDSRGVVNF
jgi:hypothetical protein